MSGNRGCLGNTLLFLVIVFIPVLGHFLATLMVIEDDHSPVGKLLWLIVIWLMPPFVVLGPLLYLFFGQRPHRGGRVTFGHPSNYNYQQQHAF